MMNLKRALFGEQSITKVAGLYKSRIAARQDAEELIGNSKFDGWQVSVLGPAQGAAGIEAVDERILPDEAGMVQTLVRAHVTMGLLGGLSGALFAAVLLAAGNVAIRSSPGMGVGACLFVGAIFGLLAGGLLALRPDQSRLISLVKATLRQGNWAVVAHPVDERQAVQAVASLHGRSFRVVRSL